MSKLDLLLQSIVGIKAICDTHAIKFAINVNVNIPDKKSLRKTFLLSEITQTLIPLQLIHQRLETLKKVVLEMQEMQKNLPSGNIDPQTELGFRYLKILNDFTQLNSELTFFIKALYEWLYHIRERVRLDNSISSLLPVNLKKRLDRYCDYRDKLITHKDKLQVYVSEGIRYENHYDTAEIFLTVMNPPKTAQQELTNLFDDCQQYLSEEERKQENYFERISLLDKNIHKFDDTKKAKVSSFISRFGTISAQPYEIAEFLLTMCKAIIPKLK